MMIFKDLLTPQDSLSRFEKFIRKAAFLLLTLGVLFPAEVFSQCTQLVWQDEFNTTSLDLTKWVYETGNGCPSLCGFGNGELQYYTSGTNNIAVDGNYLNITAKYQPNYNGSGNNYTSGKITTQGKASWKYGRMEASIKVPSATAIWPAFWMLPNGGNWPYTGEIDIMETQNTNTNILNQTIHYYSTPWASHQYTGVAYNNGTNWASTFHLYAVDWTPNQVKFSVDGITTATYTPASLNGGNTADWPFNASNFFAILNLAVGGAYTGYATPNPANYPQTMQVDYVRIYSNPSALVISGQKTMFVGDTKYYGITSAGAAATYNWTVPSGATIVSGQGTTTIQVSYAGATNGNIVCMVDGDGAGTACTAVAVNYGVKAFVKICGIFLDDFESNRFIGDVVANGTLSAVGNPGPGGSNTSSTVGKYDRNSAVTYDILAYDNFLVDNPDDFRTGLRYFTMDVRSNAPANTPITIEFVNKAQVVNAYPDGRHSQYVGVTGATNTWTKVTFAFNGSPDAVLTANDVDRIQILFNPNSNVAGQTFWFDNFIAQGKTPVTSAITGATTACLSQTNIPYSVTNTAGSTYAWTAPGATIVSGQGTNAITVTMGTANTTVSVVETTAAKCVGVAVTKNVTVAGSCTLTPNFTATPLSTCVGNKIVFTNTTTGSSGGETYSWDFGAGATPATFTGVGPVNVTYSSSGSKTITLTVTNGGGPNPVTKTNYITIATPPATCLYEDNFDNGVVNFSAVSTPAFTISETGGARRLTTAGHGEWETFTHTLNNGTAAAPINFSCAANKPVLKLRVKASGNCLLRVAMVDGTGRPIDNYAATDLAITTTYQTFTINYAGHFSNTFGNPGPVDSTNITQLLFYINPGFASFPIPGYASAFNGTLDIDWEGIGNSCSVPGTAPTITGFTPVCGVAGTPVTITGTNLTGATSVSFNGTNGTITSNTATQIVVNAPAGVTAGTITVNTPSGSVTSAASFNVTAPQPTAIVAGTASPCANSTGNTYTVTNVPGVTYTWSYSGTNATVNTGAGTNSISVTYAGSSNGTWTVTPSTVACGNGTPRTLAVTLTTPASNGTITGSAAPCQGTATTYTVGAIAGASSYSWTLPSGWTGVSSTTSIIATPNATAGNITVKGLGGCISTTEATFAVTPAAPATTGAITGSSTPCQGAATTYSVIAVPGATSYNWSLPSGWTGSSTTNTITATPSATSGFVSVVAQGTCISSASASVNAIVQTTPNITYSVVPVLALCRNGDFMIQTTDANVSYQPYISGVPVGAPKIGTGAALNFALGVGGTVTVQATRGTCTAVTMTDKPVVVKDVAPEISSITAGTASPCVTSTGNTYAVSVTNGQLTTGYTWSYSGSNQSITAGNNTGNITVSYASSTSGIWTVYATNACGNGASKTLNVTLATPTANGPINGTTTPCQGSATTYMAPAIAGATYTWVIPGGWSGSSTTNTISVTPNGTPGTITVKANGTCISTVAATASITPVAGGTGAGAIGGNAAPCSGVATTYSITAVPGATGYTWTLPSGWTGSSSTNSITATPTTTGGQITVAAIGACVLTTPSTYNVTPVASQATGAILGSTTPCQGAATTYSVTAVPGATSYTWTLPSGWTGTSTTNSISATPNSATGQIQVVANGTCISITPAVVNVTPAAPTANGPINGTTTPCQGSATTYMAPAIAGATYTWVIPGGWSGSSTTNTISVTPNGTPGTITVKANGTCISTVAATASITPVAGGTGAGAIGGNAAPCSGVATTYSITAVPGATGYTWTLPSGWTGSSSTNSISATPTTTGGQITVAAIGACVLTTPSTYNVTPVASQTTGAITGNANPCQGTSTTYSVTPVAGATSYTWTFPSGWGSSPAAATVNATPSAIGGNITVVANGTCISTTPAQLLVSPTPLAVTSSISGSATPCQGIATTYNLVAVPGATSYTWTLPSGWTGTSTTNIISVTPSATTGNITVLATGTCISNIASSLNVTPVAGGTGAGTITGSATPCQGTVTTYSITAVPGASSYTWTLPGGWTGTSTTISISATPNAAAGNVTVAAVGACVLTTPSSKAITPTALATTGAITGSTIPCQGTPTTYSVVPVPGATSYNWTLPSGWTGTSTTNTISATAGATGGNITVLAVGGACISSSLSSLAVVTNTVPSTAGAISGVSTVTQGQTNVIYSVPSIVGNTYNWTYTGGTGATITSGQGSNSILITFSGTASSGTLNVTASNVCGGPSPATTFGITVTTTSVTPQPDPFTTSSAVVCRGASNVVYTVPPAPTTSYTWTYSGAGVSINGTGNSITLNFNMVATGGTLSVTANNGNATSLPRTLVITVNSLAPQPSAISGTTTVTAGQTGLTYSVAPVSGVTFNWSYSGLGVTIVSGQGTNSVVVDYSSTASSGDLEVIATNASCGTGLPTSLPINVSPATGIAYSKAGASYTLDVYPNPATSSATVELDIKQTAVMRISLFDMLGNEVRVLTDNEKFTSGKQLFSIDDLAYGIYFIKAKSGEEVVTVKLIKY